MYADTLTESSERHRVGHHRRKTPRVNDVSRRRDDREDAPRSSRSRESASSRTRSSSSSSRGSSSRSDTLSRAEQKARTRTALVEAALDLSRTQGFSGLSLRDVARAAGIVPTAFYRHFDSLDDLGIALVEDGMRIARGISREIRRQAPKNLADAMQILADQVDANPDELRFVVTERYIAPTEVRRALNTEMRLLVHEMAIDLARREDMRRWDSDELTSAANLILAIASNAVAELVQPDADEKETIRAATDAMRMAFVGLTNWRSADADS